MISNEAHAECVRLLDLLTTTDMQEKWSVVFMTPVSREDYPDYYDTIKKPMDLSTVRKNLGSRPKKCRIKSYLKYIKDLRLIFQNAMIYNKADEGTQGSV